VPSADVVTDDSLVTATGPSTASVAVAPASTYVERASAVVLASPFNVITGASLSIQLISKVASSLWFSASSTW